MTGGSLAAEETDSARMRGAGRATVIAAALALSVLLAPGDANGQGWTVDLYGGEVAYESATTVGGAGAVLGLRYREPDAGWLYLSSGVPFGTGDTFWGAAGLGRRFAHDAGRFELGADLELHGYLHRDPSFEAIGRGGTLGARPLVAVEEGALRLEARSGWVQYESRIADAAVSRGVHDSDAGLHVGLGGRARISGTVRHVRAAEDDYSHIGGRFTVRADRATAWGSVGSWLSDALPTTGWSAGASFDLDAAGRTILGLSYRRDTSDPLYWNAPRERWSVGVSHRLGGGSAPEAASARERRPTRIGAEVPSGRVTIRIPLEGGSSNHPRPAVAGDFTGWEPVPMEQDGEHWTAEFELEPGVYRYAFRSPDGEWYVPESVPNRRDDGMGGVVAVLVVS